MLCGWGRARYSVGGVEENAEEGEEERGDEWLRRGVMATG